jgi:hypothetical protein
MRHMRECERARARERACASCPPVLTCLRARCGCCTMTPRPTRTPAAGDAAPAGAGARVAPDGPGPGGTTASAWLGMECTRRTGPRPAAVGALPAGGTLAPASGPEEWEGYLQAHTHATHAHHSGRQLCACPRKHAERSGHTRGKLTKERESTRIHTRTYPHTHTYKNTLTHTDRRKRTHERSTTTETQNMQASMQSPQITAARHMMAPRLWPGNREHTRCPGTLLGAGVLPPRRCAVRRRRHRAPPRKGAQRACRCGWRAGRRPCPPHCGPQPNSSHTSHTPRLRNHIAHLMRWA